jgi:hypothetical protein
VTDREGWELRHSPTVTTDADTISATIRSLDARRSGSAGQCCRSAKRVGGPRNVG